MTEPTMTRIGTASRDWKRSALSASLETQPRRKLLDYGRFHQDTDCGPIVPQSPTKQKAVRFRGSWGPDAQIVPHPPDLRSWLPRTGAIDVPATWHLRQAEARPVTRKVFKGRVDDVVNGLAIVTLYSDGGEVLAAEWPERDLAKISVGRGDLFELVMTDTGDAVLPSLRKVRRKGCNRASASDYAAFDVFPFAVVS